MYVCYEFLPSIVLDSLKLTYADVCVVWILAKPFHAVTHVASVLLLATGMDASVRSFGAELA